MSALHTKGPWPAPREPNGRGMGWQAGPAWLGVDAHSEETAANALLISAAPDLLETCQTLLNFVLSGNDYWRDDIDAARAAIAKATGGSA